jgi:hypothetical protein
VSTVAGFDYQECKPLNMAAWEWRKRYPEGRFVRTTGNAKGETWYWLGNPQGKAAVLVAEAYGNVPK